MESESETKSCCSASTLPKSRSRSSLVYLVYQDARQRRRMLEKAVHNRGAPVVYRALSSMAKRSAPSSAKRILSDRKWVHRYFILNKRTRR